MPKPKSHLLTALTIGGFLLLGIMISIFWTHRFSYEKIQGNPSGFILEEQEEGLLLKRLPDMAEQFVGGEWGLAGSENGNLILFQNQEEKVQIYHFTSDSISELEYPARETAVERVAFSKDNEWFFIEWPTELGYLYCIVSGWDIKSQNCNSFELQGEGRLHWSAEDSSTYVRQYPDGTQAAYRVGETSVNKDQQTLLNTDLKAPSLALRLAWIFDGKVQKSSVPSHFVLSSKKGVYLLDTLNKKIVISGDF